MGSPSNTTLGNTPLASWKLTAANYDCSAITTAIDPTATNTDFGADGNDQFISHVVPFDALVTQFASYGIAVDENTAFRYVMGTGTQPNSLNQDVGATTVGWSDATTWEALGAISSPYTATGDPVPAPEPDSLALTLFGFAPLAVAARRSRREAWRQRAPRPNPRPTGVLPPEGTAICAGGALLRVVQDLAGGVVAG